MARSRPSANPKTETQRSNDAFAYSDDECVQKLAALLEHRDSASLEEIVRLMTRLAIPIE